MATPLLQHFPSLEAYPPDFLKDLLSSPDLTEAFLFQLPEVQELAAEVERLGRENDELARTSTYISCLSHMLTVQVRTCHSGTSSSRCATRRRSRTRTPRT